MVSGSFQFAPRSVSSMFRVDAPFGGSGKREAVSTGDKTMTGGCAAPASPVSDHVGIVQGRSVPHTHNFLIVKYKFLIR